MDSAASSISNQEPINGEMHIMERCNKALVHACQCRDANCRLTCCQNMKQLTQHNEMCQRKINGGCPSCMRLQALSLFHAKSCLEQKCPVPFCLKINHKMEQQRLQHQLQQAQQKGACEDPAPPL